MPFEQARERDQRARVRPTSARPSSRSTSRSCATQAIIEWKNDELKKAYDEGAEAGEAAAAGALAGGTDCIHWTIASAGGAVVRDLDAVAPRAGRPRAARAEAHRRVPADDHHAGAAGRIARRRSTGRCSPATASRGSIPTNALPVLKCTGVVNIVSFDGKPAPIPEHELDSIRLLVEQRAAVRSVPADSRRHDGRSHARPAQGRRRPAGAQGRAEGAARAVGRSDRPGASASKSTPPTSSRIELESTMKIGSVELASPFVVAPMAGMTDTAFRRLVKRHGGCGLVVTEMVSVRGAGARHRSHARVRRVHRGRAAGLDPDLRRRSRRRWPTAAQIVEGMGADIVDVNMGCPVPKIAKHNAGCSLMREPAHAAERDRARWRRR